MYQSTAHCSFVQCFLVSCSAIYVATYCTAEATVKCFKILCFSTADVVLEHFFLYSWGRAHCSVGAVFRRRASRRVVALTSAELPTAPAPTVSPATLVSATAILQPWLFRSHFKLPWAADYAPPAPLDAMLVAGLCSLAPTLSGNGTFIIDI